MPRQTENSGAATVMMMMMVVNTNTHNFLVNALWLCRPIHFRSVRFIVRDDDDDDNDDD